MDMPFVHEDLAYVWVPADDPMMVFTKQVRDVSTCYKQRTGAAIVDDWADTEDGMHIAAWGNNGVRIPQESCPRIGMPTGTGYELCESTCGGNLHAEAAAVEMLKRSGYKAKHGLSLYLYGHWWCCEDCCNRMVTAGIEVVYLVGGHGPDTKWGEV